MIRLACASLLVGVAGCGQPEPYAEWTTYVAPDGEYRVEYLDPPWELIDSDGSTVRLEVPNNSSRLGSRDASLAAKYELTITLSGGRADARVSREVSRARARGEDILLDPSPVETRSGDEGFEIVTRETAPQFLFRRLVWIDRPGGGTVHLAFATVPHPQEAEVDAMIESVDVDPGAP